MRKKVLLKRMAAMGMAAALAISSFCLPESQVTVHAGNITADSETVPEETPETEKSSEQKSDETPETETTATKEEVGENTAEQTEIPSVTDAATAPEADNEPETVAGPDETGDTKQADENETEPTKDTDDTALTEETEELAAAGTAFYTGTAAKSSTSLNLTTEDWDNKAEITYDESISDITVPENFTMTATVSLDQASYNSLSGSGYLKIQGVVKLGDDWKWNDSQDIKELKSSDFTKSDSNYQTDISIAFTDITPASLRGIYFEIVGQGFNGTISVSNVKLLKGEDTAPLPQQGPYTIDDFEDATIGTNAGWTKEDGYKYSGDVTTSVASLNGSKQLEVGLDYSNDSAEGWSEAKIKKNIAEGIDVSAYNLLTFDITYPSQFDGFKAKAFAQNYDENKKPSSTEIINKDTSVEGTDIGGNMKKATVSIKFQPNKEKLTDLTLGIVGVNTSFKGSVYIDNIILSQYDSSADFVDITSTPGAGTQADTSQMPGDIVLADADATATAKSLYSYLKGLDAADQVLFGHQNDTHKCVGKNDGVYSDTKDMTGSISGIVGIDSLALTGAELGMTDVSAAVAKSVEISEKAASEGAIITLSTHMPNMSNAKIKATPDGKYKYDFSGCDFTESKDLSNNCAKEVLPGGKYNAQFTTFMDIIADYALALQAKNIPVLFRPYHENSGGWFWWGAASTDVETYNALFRYTEDYLSSKGVHNFIYVYSPNGPITSEEEYAKRYPGDDYVDIVAFDYYNDYNSYPAEYSDSFMNSLRTTCQVVKSFGDKRGKVAAIAETGVRVMKADGSDIEGILVKDNPIKGHNWYSQVNQIAKETGMPYYLVWANFGDTNFYVPYKNGEKGQELINEFIDFYNDSSSIFANGTNFYGNAADKAVTNSNPKNPRGYFTNVFPKDVIKEGKVLSANVRNASQVQFVLQNGKKTETLNAKSNETSYEATVTKKMLDDLGLTDIGTISLVADGKTLAVLTFISFGKEKDTLSANMIEDFELYYGDNDYLGGTYTENSAAACSSAFELDSKNKSGGSYGGAFHYQLKTNGPEVWTGRMKGLESNDHSADNCLTMWVKPDGKGQKLVIQLVSNGEDFEVHLTDFVKTTEARYITIPFSELKGKQNGTFDPKSVTTFAVWCNSIAPEGQKGVDIDSSIVFDDIQFANVDLSKLTIANGYAVTEKPVVQPEEKTKITLPKKAAVKKGKTLQLKATVTPADAKKAGVTWTSSDQKIATVNSNGKVTGKKYGRVTITAKANDGSGVKATCKLTVGYGITYKLNKGKNNSKNPAAYYNEKVKLEKPSRKGYAFKGWYTDKKFKKKITTIKKGTKKNYTLYAKWEKIKVKKTALTSAKNSKSKQIALKYKKVSGAKGYEISYSTDKKFKKSVTKKTTNKTSYTIKNLKKGKTYYVRVRAYKKDSAGKKVYGKYTKVKKIKVNK